MERVVRRARIGRRRWRRRDGGGEDGRTERVRQRWRLACHDRLLDRVGRQPRFGGGAREGLPGPRDRWRGRRLRDNRAVAAATAVPASAFAVSDQVLAPDERKSPRAAWARPTTLP